ncbi:MAG: hypothetical protein JOZ05_19675, partial [Acetobacteraceae bacterium]|nr:hypothetical protein [Acetobacteraceae bacterium]
MTSLDRLPAMPPAEPPGHAEAVENLRAGNAFTCVLSDDPDERAILLQSVIDAAADMETRFVRVCNPLRAPLTIERVFLQAVGPDAEVRLERNGEALTRILAARFADETRLIVAIEQAETLDSDALQALHDMAPSFPTVVPRVQLLFCGPKSFAATLAPPKPAPAPPAPAINRALADEITSAVALPVGRRRGRAPIVLALLLAAVAAAGAL